jgi:hypothetical protein
LGVKREMEGRALEGRGGRHIRELFFTFFWERILKGVG